MRTRSWLALLNTAVFIVFVVIGWGLVWMFMQYPVKDAGHIAAWFQAIGSIGAILGAFMVAKHQATMQEKIRRRLADEESQAREAAYLSIMEVAKDYMLTITERIQNKDLTEELAKWIELEAEGLRLAAASLDSISLFEIGGTECITVFSGFRQGINNYHRLIESRMPNSKRIGTREQMAFVDLSHSLKVISDLAYSHYAHLVHMKRGNSYC
ncbi:hypothetical protein [Alcaligenes faecalis]|uniref:hypothetical protein n=1 Tax=Alcaligenes faecalis TaxID=511 RepID=UPI00129323A1|nr:hypothetical protein [Alcaligenes faecalis]